MKYRIFAALAFLGVCAAVHAQVEIGTVDLYFVGLGSDDGAFEWSTGPGGTGMDVFTYCFSTNNYFDPSENPQVFDVWTVDGATTSSVASSGMLATNDMSGLTPLHFLEAAAQAESYGTPDLSGAFATDNANIHDTETNGNSLYDGMDYSDVWYLEQANPSSYAYGGQPQVYIAPGGGNNLSVPGPFSGLPMLIGIGGLALRRKSKRA